MATSIEVLKLRARPPAHAGLAPLAGVSLRVRPGEILAVIGDRGSGAGTLARALVGPLPEGSSVTGRVRVDGADPQDPAATPGRHAAYLGPQPELHPRKPLGRQLMASLDAAGYDRRDAERRTGALLRAVGLGGAHATHPQRMGVLERHRAALALALTPGARVVVADRVGEESDTFVRAELRALLREARDYLDLAIVHLTQDVGGVADLADRVVVLDGGRVVEDAPVRGFFSAPSGPLAKSLIAAAPRLKVSEDASGRAAVAQALRRVRAEESQATQRALDAVARRRPRGTDQGAPAPDGPTAGAVATTTGADLADTPDATGVTYGYDAYATEVVVDLDRVEDGAHAASRAARVPAEPPAPSEPPAPAEPPAAADPVAPGDSGDPADDFDPGGVDLPVPRTAEPDDAEGVDLRDTHVREERLRAVEQAWGELVVPATGLLAAPSAPSRRDRRRAERAAEAAAEQAAGALPALPSNDEPAELPLVDEAGADDAAPHRVDPVTLEPEGTADIEDVDAADLDAGDAVDAGEDPDDGDAQDDGPGTGRPLLQVRDVRITRKRRWFDAPERVVDGVDLTLRRGETLGVLGTSGSGTSALLRAVHGLEPVAGGSIAVAGHAPRAGGASAHTALLCPDPRAGVDESATVADHLAGALHHVLTGHDDSDVAFRTRVLLEDVGLDRAAGALRLDALDDERRHRVALAAALAGAPALLLADEPTLLLDAVTQRSFLRLLGRVRERRRLSLLVAGHDPALLAFVADRVVVLDQGRIVESGLAADVLSSPAQEVTERLVLSVPVPNPLLQARRRELRSRRLVADGGAVDR